MIYGYARVSTLKQATDGNGLESQINSLKAAGAEKIYADAYTGVTLERPELDKLLSIINEGDVVVVTKLDRIARSVKQGLELIQDLLSKKISIHILNMGVYENSTPQSNLMLTLMLAFAEFERDLILERTKDGKIVKRSKGLRAEGRLSLKINQNDLAELYALQQKRRITVNEACKKLGIKRTSWYKYTKLLKK